MGDSDSDLLDRLRAADEDAFNLLVERYHAAMVRLAGDHVASRAIAEEVAQEAWVGVLRGLAAFEGRSSLKTWIFSIVFNLARRRGAREHRDIPLSALGDFQAEGPSVEPRRFNPPGDQAAGMWASPPVPWHDLPESSALSAELRHCIATAIDALPSGQRSVIRLRDVEGWTSTEVCDALQLTETNQRVLLHRARSKVRQSLEIYFSDAGR